MTDSADQDSKVSRTCSNGFPVVDGYNCCDWWKNSCDPCFNNCLNEATVSDLMKENKILATELNQSRINIAKKLTEIALLTQECDIFKNACTDHMNAIGELTQDVEKLEAEVERLREVLRRIAATHSSAECEMDGYGKVWHGIDCPQKLAIDGLGETGNV